LTISNNSQVKKHRKVSFQICVLNLFFSNTIFIIRFFTICINLHLISLQLSLNSIHLTFNLIEFKSNFWIEIDFKWIGIEFNPRCMQCYSTFTFTCKLTFTKSFLHQRINLSSHVVHSIPKPKFVISGPLRMVKAYYSDPLCVVTLYYFYGWSFFNLNHVKITKDFHNVLHIMVKPNPR
jgi:hypothetical protein